MGEGGGFGDCMPDDCEEFFFVFIRFAYGNEESNWARLGAAFRVIPFCSLFARDFKEILLAGFTLPFLGIEVTNLRAALKHLEYPLKCNNCRQGQTWYV